MRTFVCVVYSVLLAVVSLVPRSQVDRLPRFFPGEDKLAHFLAYGLYGVIVAWTLRIDRSNRRWKRVMVATGVCALYGIVLELLQAAFPQIGRAFSFSDIAANTAGAFVFTLPTYRSSER